MFSTLLLSIWLLVFPALLLVPGLRYGCGRTRLLLAVVGCEGLVMCCASLGWLQLRPGAEEAIMSRYTSNAAIPLAMSLLRVVQLQVCVHVCVTMMQAVPA